MLMSFVRWVLFFLIFWAGNHEVWSQQHGTIRPGSVEAAGPDFSLLTGYPLPFEENWSSGWFAGNQWEFSPSQGNWNIAYSPGSIDPSAEFNGNPPLSNYNHSLVSPVLDATVWDCAVLWLDFDYRIITLSSSGTEKLLVEIQTDTSWTVLKVLRNTASTGFTPVHLDIRQALQKSFRIRFRAAGSYSGVIQAWYVDNIRVYGECYAAKNLRGHSKPSYTDVYWEHGCSPFLDLRIWYHSDMWYAVYNQEFNHAYGVVFNLTAYPLAILNHISFFHVSFGKYENWPYKIHVVDWDTFSELLTLGPFITTGMDKWESTYLGDMVLLGGKNIAIFMEPMGYDPVLAYPLLAGDDLAISPSSFVGQLPDYSLFTNSEVGDFFIDLHIEVPDYDSSQNSGGASSYRSPLSAIQLRYKVFRGSTVSTSPFTLLTPDWITTKYFTDYTAPHPWYENLYYVVTQTENSEGEVILCEKASDTIVPLPLGFQDHSAVTISVFPNPAEDYIYIDCHVRPLTVKVLNGIGQTVREISFRDEGQIAVDVAGFKEGLYLFRISAGSSTATKKIVIRR